MPLRYTWNAEKNEELRLERGLSFEVIVAVLDEHGPLDDIENPSSNFPGQRALVVMVDGYTVVVPYVADGEDIFLKTAFRSRRAKKFYLPKGE